MLKATEGGANARLHASLFPLAVEGLVYKDRERALIDGLSLRLEATRRTVVLGPNGAGKSLLLRLLHGLLTPTGGSISWAGRPLDDAIQARQALVFQRPMLLRRSALANLTFVLSHLPRAEGEARARDLLAAARLAHVAATPARLLSGGEQQRLSLVRALAREPDVLFLDEPSASLDPAATAHIEQMISEAAEEGTKIVLVTHDLGQARRIAEDVVFMHQGRVIETSAAEAFFTGPQSKAARDYVAGRLVL